MHWLWFHRKKPPSKPEPKQPLSLSISVTSNSQKRFWCVQPLSTSPDQFKRAAVDPSPERSLKTFFWFNSHVLITAALFYYRYCISKQLSLCMLLPFPFASSYLWYALKHTQGAKSRPNSLNSTCIPVLSIPHCLAPGLHKRFNKGTTIEGIRWNSAHLTSASGAHLLCPSAARLFLSFHLKSCRA